MRVLLALDFLSVFNQFARGHHHLVTLCFIMRQSLMAATRLSDTEFFEVDYVAT